MNIYFVALIGLIAMLAVGFITYGQIFKQALLTEDGEKTDYGHLTQAVIGMYIASLLFVHLFDVVNFGASGVARGLELGAIVALLFALPLYIDSPFFKTKGQFVGIVLGNWVVSFLVLGLVVGLLR